MGKDWDKWRKPPPGQTPKLRQSPTLDPIDENLPSPTFHDLHSLNWNHSWNIDTMLDNSWPSGDARNFTPTDDQWNDSSTGGAAQWKQDGASGFNDAPPDDGFGDTGAGNMNGEGPSGGASGACFNCGQGMLTTLHCIVLTMVHRRSHEVGMPWTTKVHWRVPSMWSNWVHSIDHFLKLLRLTTYTQTPSQRMPFQAEEVQPMSRRRS